MNLAVSSAVTLLVLTLTLFAVTRFQRRLENAAAVDAMTGMLNRQHFESAFEQARRDARRSRQPMSLILVDIDLFKAINDQYGHLAGDKVIAAVADLIRGSVRQNDVLGRWGGEEFLILLKDCRSEPAYALADKLRQSIRGATLPLRRRRSQRQRQHGGGRVPGRRAAGRHFRARRRLAVSRQGRRAQSGRTRRRLTLRRRPATAAADSLRVTSNWSIR